MTDLTFIDLFAGIGGNHIALERNGFESVYTSEWDKNCSVVLFNNYGVEVNGDITKIDETSIPDHTLLSAGFPCQAFSISGKRLGFEDTRGTLFFDVARIIKEKRPPLVLLENVRNFASHDGGRTLEVVRTTMEQLGYTFTHQLYNASDFGVPQNRQRVFMAAIRKDINDTPFVFPEPPHIAVSLRDVLLPPEEVEDLVITHRNDIVLTQAAIDKAIAVNKPIRVGHLGKGGQGERIYSDLGHAITLSAYGGGVGAKTGLYYTAGVNGDMVVRKLHPRECARLQGFPESFQLPNSRTQAWQQFGNSVPVPIVESVTKAMLRHIS